MRHTYFTDGVLRELTAQPTPGTAEFLRQTGLLFCPRSDGFVVLTTNSRPAPPAGFPLTFTLQPLSPYFVNYSNLPLPAEGAAIPAYCFDGDALASTPASVTCLEFRPLVFRQPLPPMALATAELCSYPHGTVVQHLTVPAQANSLLLDVRAFGSGRYQLNYGSQSIIFYADDYLAATRPWGVLVLDAPLSQNQPDHTLAFEARSTFWQYQLIAGKAPLPAGLLIADSSQPNQPAFGVGDALPGAAASLKALAARPLAQRYTTPPYQLQLPAAGPGGQFQLLYPALPQASPALLRQLKIKKEYGARNVQLITDIYVAL